MIPKFKIFLILVVFVAGIYVGYTMAQKDGTAFKWAKKSNVTNYEECVRAGNAIMESYPEQCRNGDETFTRDIGNVLEKRDLIRIESPQPGDLVRSPLVITGEARGYWFFEGSFGVRLEDTEGNLISQHFVQSQTEWMTESFVSYIGTLDFVVPEGVTRGRLILEKQNASGLEEHADHLEIPVRFE